MKGFIEVTRLDNNRKVFFAVEKIIYAEQCANGNAFIMFWNYGYKYHTFNLGIETVESYSEVCKKIEEAGK